MEASNRNLKDRIGDASMRNYYWHVDTQRAYGRARWSDAQVADDADTALNYPGSPDAWIGSANHAGRNLHAA